MSFVFLSGANGKPRLIITTVFAVYFRESKRFSDRVSTHVIGNQ